MCLVTRQLGSLFPSCGPGTEMFVCSYTERTTVELAEEASTGFMEAKRAVKQVQKLDSEDPALPRLLDVYVTQQGVSWGLW